VVDNGDGMAHEEVEVAALRHYTSKIQDYKDLDKLTTFGFRGLPSSNDLFRIIVNNAFLQGRR
jgi:DNA mismatch repair ATPase MutL